MVSVGDVRGGGFREAGIGKRCLESPLRFGEFCQYDLFRGNSEKLKRFVYGADSLNVRGRRILRRHTQKSE
jgi:hypothetical protein